MHLQVRKVSLALRMIESSSTYDKCSESKDSRMLIIYSDFLSESVTDL